MKTHGFKNFLMLIALVLAVVVAIPVAGALAILLRGAGLVLIGGGVAAAAIAFTISPTFRGHLRSLA